MSSVGNGFSCSRLALIDTSTTWVDWWMNAAAAAELKTGQLNSSKTRSSVVPHAVVSVRLEDV